MSAKITGLKELQQALKKMQREIDNKTKKAIRKSLNAGAKEIKDNLKSNVPVMKSSTNFRQKGVLKKNIRHKIRLSKNGELAGKATVFFSDKNKAIAYKDRERNRFTQSGKLLTGPVKIYLNDPYFWHMVDRGTVTGVKAQHFIKKAEVAKDRAQRTAYRTLEKEMKDVIK
ncbi:HK97-gp10 family putative phage morphogenesis protein [Mannheimia haemolytica]